MQSLTPEDLGGGVAPRGTAVWPEVGIGLGLEHAFLRVKCKDLSARRVAEHVVTPLLKVALGVHAGAQKGRALVGIAPE